MANPDDKKHPETPQTPLEKSTNHQREQKEDRSSGWIIEYGNEDRQVVKDELPPVFPDSDDD